ncbi:hypothetical protein SASPL_155685 [Salvia splendens]|uniref:PPM-type phosphatase domain-containing protein n=1 Tax=Salvia splendens TaxID=180675 RepID=A0A8X8YXZ5_SALSN|nr:hypothetical protein SASPL_155685 [Salvia splendens]
MGCCFSSQSLSMHNPRIFTQVISKHTETTLQFGHGRIESSFCMAQYRPGPMPYLSKVVQNVVDATGQDTNFDCYCSTTTTAITLCKQGEDLTIAQIGNSGAVVGMRDKNNALIAVRLTANLKPIQNCRTLAKPHNRKDARDIILGPIIYHRRITDQDDFVVLATGEVWEVLPIEQVVAIVATRPRRSAAKAVVDAAVAVWTNEHPNAEVDDCAVACLFLRPTTNSTPHSI